MVDLEQQIINLSLKTVYIASAVLVVSVILAVLLKKNKMVKLPLFLLIAGSMIVPTIVMSVGTIYLNTHAESNGPVHWHADIEFWACGAELELRDPTGRFSNKIGSSTFHEHNDKRLHLEGVVVHKKTDASLEKFMRLSKGYLADDRIAVPLSKSTSNDPTSVWFASEEKGKIDGDKQKPENFHLSTGFSSGPDLASDLWVEQTKDGPLLVLANGNRCSSDDPLPAEVQVFVYRFNKQDNTYSQEKLAKPTDYILRDESLVPPGDCVIVEFDQPKARTDKLCEQYGVRDVSRCTQFGVKEFTSELCNIREVN